MGSKSIQAVLDELVEKLASMEHERWSHWQRYMHSKCTVQSDGSLVISPDLVARWEKQIATPYAELSDIEKESDREQVRKYFPIIVDAFRDTQQE